MEKLIKASLGLLILILLAMLFLLRSPKRNSAAPSPSPVGSIPAPSPATANETTAVAEPSPIALAPPIAQPAAPVTPSGGNMSASKIKEFAPPTIPAEMAARPPEIPSVIAPPPRFRPPRSSVRHHRRLFRTWRSWRRARSRLIRARCRSRRSPPRT